MRSRFPQWLVGACLVILLGSGAVTAQTVRIFYRAEDWLATSPETQTHMINGVLRAWEHEAEIIEAREFADPQLSSREREMLRLLECVHVSPGLTTEEVRRAIQVYAGHHSKAIFSTVADFVGRALDRRCPAPPAR